MRNFSRDFEERVQEIELYFSFMENVMKCYASLLFPDGRTENFSDDLNKIFRANSFLLLYNLSESCVKNAIEEIYSTITTRRTNYDNLKEGVQTEIIKFLKNHVNAQEFTTNVNEICFDIITNGFGSDKLLSGNLDARKIKDLSIKYGFLRTISPITNSDGTVLNIDSDSLLTIKTRRNDLAHGIYSFKECGRDYTIEDLITIKINVIEYLRQILNHIDLYINNSDYLR